MQQSIARLTSIWPECCYLPTPLPRETEEKDYKFEASLDYKPPLRTLRMLSETRNNKRTTDKPH